jgi:hypothetical protein
MANQSSSHDSLLEHHLELRPWRELALLMLVGMEISWVTPWFRSLTPATYAIPPWNAALILMGIMLFSLWMVRILDFLRLRTSIRQGVTVGLLAVGLFIGFKTLLYPHESVPLGQIFTRPLQNIADARILVPEEFVVALTVLIGWWRGIALAQERLGPAVVRDHFIVGIAMYVVYGFLNTMVTGETPGNFIFIFLFCALLGMAAARFSILNTIRGGRQASFDRRWFTGVTLASIVTVGLALLLGDLFTRNLQWIGYLIMGFLGLIAMLLWLILTPILAFLIRALSLGDQNLQILQQITEQAERFQNMMRELMQRISTLAGIDKVAEAFTSWAPGIKLVLLGSILGLVVIGILVWLAIQVSKERKRRQLAEEQMGLYNQGDFWRLLQKIMRQRWNNLVQNLGNVTDFRKRARLRAAERIRQVYSELMDLCNEFGKPRPEAQTPLEFLPELVNIFPEQEAEVSLITQAYLSVRYGELPETRQEVLDVEQAWKLVLKTGKELVEEQKQPKHLPGRLVDKPVQPPRSSR